MKVYGFTESAVTLIFSYQCDRLHRVKIGNILKLENNPTRRFSRIYIGAFSIQPIH